MDKPESALDTTGSRKMVVPPASGSGTEAYARWLEHMQRSRTRHAAITRNLYSWSNYKSWADKMRSSWKSDDDKT